MLPLVLLLHLALSVLASVIFEDCGSAYRLQTVNIEGCGMSLPCYVTLGEEVSVSVQFLADFSSVQLDQDVVLNINFINLSTEVTPEPCETVDCPVRTNSPNYYTSIMHVPNKVALNQRGFLRWRVYNESGRLVLCYSVTVQTQSPLQKLLRQGLTEMTAQINRQIDTVHSQPIETPINETGTIHYLHDLVDRYYDMKRELTRE